MYLPGECYRISKSAQGTPLRPILSLPGSSYDHLNNTLAKYFDQIKGPNIETNIQMGGEILKKTQLDSDDSTIFLDVMPQGSC